MLKMAPSVYFGLETGNYAEDYEKLKAYIKKLAKGIEHSVLYYLYLMAVNRCTSL